MLIKEIWPEEDIRLNEVDLKKALRHAAAAGALGAGILGTPSKPVPPPLSSPATIDEPIQVKQLDPNFIPPPDISDEPIKIPPAKKPAANPPGIHPSFPHQLVNQPKVSGQERIQTFVNHFLPYIDSVNADILKNRRRVVYLMRNHHPITDIDKKWLNVQFEKYNVNNVQDLLKRMDIVPRSMALAQAAIESGWGTSELARKGNAFYGQKAWSTSGSIAGSPGERYSAFSNPKVSVSGYVHNLNTHPAYEGFRRQREEMREKQKTLSGFSLIGQLGRYSTKGEDYIQQIRGLIGTPQFRHLDDFH